MKKTVLILLTGCLSLISGCSREEKKATAQGDFLVINVLDKPFYDDSHIKGSIHVPFMEVADFAQPLNKQTGIVVYCSNYACSASGAAAQQLRDMGFTDVAAYEGGMAEWFQLQFPVEGPSVKEYLRAENRRMGTEEEKGSIISAQDLKKRMEQHKLL